MKRVVMSVMVLNIASWLVAGCCVSKSQKDTVPLAQEYEGFKWALTSMTHPGLPYSYHLFPAHMSQEQYQENTVARMLCSEQTQTCTLTFDIKNMKDTIDTAKLLHAIFYCARRERYTKVYVGKQYWLYIKNFVQTEYVEMLEGGGFINVPEH